MNNSVKFKINQSPNLNTFSLMFEGYSFGNEIFEVNTIAEASSNSIFAEIWSLAPDKITKIFTCRNIICIHKSSETEWGDLQNQIIKTLKNQNYFRDRPKAGMSESEQSEPKRGTSESEQSEPKVGTTESEGGTTEPKRSMSESEGGTSDIDKRITDTIAKYVQPYIADHGGHIQYHYFKDGVAYFTLHGSCSGCPSSANTLQIAVYNVLKVKVPEIVEVKTL